jgi:hypothetical protein
MTQKNTEKVETPAKVETPEVAAPLAQDQAPKGTQIFGDKVYALTGGAILLILDVLKDELTIRQTGTLQKVETVLAQAKEIRIDG